MEMEDQEYHSRGMEYGGEHRWTARDRAVMARMKQYLDRIESLKVEIEELEYGLLGPEEAEVDMRHIAMLFHFFIGQGHSEFLAVGAARWNEYSRMLARQEEECQEFNEREI